MRIRPILRISGAVAVVCVAMVAATISTLLVRETQEAAQAKLLDETVRQLSIMRSLQPDFSGGASPRAIRQWRVVYEGLTPLLQAIPAADERSETIKARILQEHSDLDNLFSHLVQASQGAAEAAVREMISGQLSVRTAAMISEVLAVRRLKDDRTTRTRNWLTAGVAMSVTALTGVILWLLIILHRRIVFPVAKLEEATARLTAGFLDQPVRMSGNDEVSALADSFDTMRLTLRDRLQELAETTAQLADANASLERRVAERTQQLQSAYTQIRELDQTKSRFFANLSHELRTPLALILGPVDELLAGDGLPPDGREGLEVVRRNAQMLRTYVDDLLDLSRLDAGRMTLDYREADLAQLVRFVADHFVSASTLQGVALRVVAPDSLAAQVDAPKVRRILFNLMSNAFKHAPDRTGRVEVVLRADDGRAVVDVTDNGQGVPAPMRQSIFERFIQGDDPHRSAGTGLGLAIAKEFVALHGGSITVDDAPNAGAVFRVVLPLAAPDGVRVKPVAAVLDISDMAPVHRRAPAPMASGHDLGSMSGSADPADEDALPLVLIVEDNPDLRAFIAKALRNVARIALAEDGAEGIASAVQLRPDLVLTDIMMPNMTGDRMVAEMRRHPDLSDIPVMVLSARADEPLRIRLLQGQAQDYLIKPFATDELSARVSNLLQVKRARDVLRAEVSSRQENLELLAEEVAALNRALRHAADEMRVARDKAEQASKAKSAFLNMVSHELRTPLTQLDLQLALLRRRLKDALDEKQSEILSWSAGSLQRLTGLVESVLNYIHIESGRVVVKPERFSLTELVSDACADLRHAASMRGLAFAIEADNALPPLVSDPTLVRLVVRNLVDNAVKYTAEGAVTVRLAVAEGRHSVAVADTGPGIAPELHQRMFEPFELFEDIDHKHTPGIGLGLALVKELASTLGGQISLASAVGQGSTFTIDLPNLEWGKK